VHWIARGFLLRCHLLRYMEAIKTLQRAVRRFLVRNRHKWHKVVSALSIQALWRGYRIRQMRPDVVQYLRQKKYERTRSNAIRRLFATFRCDMVRRRFLDIKQSMATLQVTATASNAKRSFARLRDCSIRMQSLWRMKVAKQKLSEMRLNEMILKEQLRIKTLREREALLLARYNKYMDSEAMWHKRVEHQLKTGIRKTKTLDLTSVVDVDIMLDTSEIYPEGWMESFTRLEQHLCKEGADGVKQVSIGNAHSVVLAESGKLYSWGWGDRGQLGLSDWENQNRPKLLKTVNHAPRHAPKVGSGSFLLGGHGGGELGGRGGAAVLRPVDATVYVKFASISCGQDHCVAVTSEGQVFTWGSNSRGQLGLGDSKSRHRPTLVCDVGARSVRIFHSLFSLSLSLSVSFTHTHTHTYTQIRSLRRQVRDAQCGAMHTICLMTGGSVYGWGAGVSSSSGSSSVDDTRRALALLPDLGRMSLNELKKHLRGLDPRRAKIIEKNVYELSSTEARKVIHEILHETLSSGGAGNRKARDAFYPVGLRFDSKSCIGQISIGWNVSVALCNSGAVYEFTPGNTPKRVRGIPSKVERVSAGARHIAALTRKGKLYMWGDNSFGQLGSGDKIDRPRGQDAVQIELPEGPVKTVTCGWRHTLALTRSGELYVWGHTLGYGFQGKGDMVEDETQEEHTSPVPLYVTEATDRCVEDVNCTFARNMSVSAVTIRQDEPEHVLTTVRRTGRKVSEKDVTRESDLARRIVQKLKHEDDEEVKYRKRMGISPRSVYKRVTGSVKKKKKKSSSPSRTIPKRELQKMGRRQLTELVKALRDEETSNKVSEHIASYNRDDEFLLGEAVYKTQNHLREDSAHHGAREIALENGWKRSMHRVESPEKREETYRAGIEYRTRWWNSVRTRGRRKGRVSRQDEDFVEKERRVVTEQKVESPSTTTTYEDNNSTFDPMMDSSNAMTIDEDDIREHFSKRFLIPRNLSNMEGKTRDGSDPLSLYRQYSRMQQQQNEDTFGNYNEEETGSSPVVVVPPESQYYGRTSSETERIRSEIRDKILNEHKDTNAEKADDLLSRHQNLGAVRSESFYERKLVKKESERGLNAFNAGRRVSTWRDLTPAERAERERKRLAVQKVKEEAKKRKQLMEQAEALKRQIEAEEQRRAQEKKMSVAARLEEIRNAVGATADTLWEGGDM